MNNFTLNTELLIRYMDGEVTGQEKLELDRRLLSEAALQEEFENLQLAREAVRINGISEKVKTIHREMIREFPVRRTVKMKQFFRYSAAVAAAVVLIVVSVLAYNFFSLSPEKLYSQYHVNYELITMRDDSVRLSVLEKAYKEKNFNGVTVFANQGKLYSDHDRLLAGLAFLELNNPAKAIPHLKNILSANKNEKDQVYQSAEYYLALAYLRNLDYDLSLELMEKINNDPSHLYHRNITARLIRKVKMLKWK
jgi:tetratricopeptide (TPR) repeat protein